MGRDRWLHRQLRMGSGGLIVMLAASLQSAAAHGIQYQPSCTLNSVSAKLHFEFSVSQGEFEVQVWLCMVVDMEVLDAGITLQPP